MKPAFKLGDYRKRPLTLAVTDDLVSVNVWLHMGQVTLFVLICNKQFKNEMQISVPSSGGC